ncbi:MAG TPA: helix-turn-helix domain-containing protein [Solimonas sp.]|nr:helix-turn-helix domain-containing protein [Solimonas sp.]
MAYDAIGSSTAFTATRTGCGPNCAQCPSRQHCLVRDADPMDTARWNGMVESLLNLPAGKALFDAGATAASTFSVRAGCIKTFTLDSEGNERVRGFHLAGDIIGLDTLTSERYPMYAVAIVPTQVCVMPREEMRQLTQHAPALMNRLIDRLSHSLRQALSLAGDYTADQRVAAFLLQMHDRLAPLPGRNMRLPMGRRDIANYLRLATETVCRVLTRFEQRGYLQVKDREIGLLDTAALRAAAHSLAD